MAKMDTFVKLNSLKFLKSFGYYFLLLQLNVLGTFPMFRLVLNW